MSTTTRAARPSWSIAWVAGQEQDDRRYERDAGEDYQRLDVNVDLRRGVVMVEQRHDEFGRGERDVAGRQNGQDLRQQSQGRNS